MSIWLTQWLCPKRHCAITLAWSSEDHTEEDIVAQGERVFSSRVLNRHCGICGGSLTPESSVTMWKTLREIEIAGQMTQMIDLLLARAAIELLKDQSRN